MLLRYYISLSVGIAFALVMLIKGTSFEWFIPYSDSTIVITVVLISIAVPIKIIIQGVKQLLLAAPSSKIQTELEKIIATVLKNLPCEQYSLKMTETGQYVYVYLLWLLPQQPESKTIQEVDLYRNELTKTLQAYHRYLNLDIIFTEDKTWFEARNGSS